MRYKLFAVKYGWVAAAWSDRGLCALTLPCTEPGQAVLGLADRLKIDVNQLVEGSIGSQLRGLEDELKRYFEGQRCDFNYPLDLSWCTPFQYKVLTSIKNIPYGETRTYRQVAEMIGRPGASRAVGGALRSNRVLLVLPCHRVICSDGSPGGFGGRPEWKVKLLEIEKK
ncbi:MAG: methylated-DNA--[protein]-cysteine S-methyltransferase [Desulfotomaculum sp.]|nr:methylated-DNA--[protein]-cysteine S-methyltransferase [Desulfotomaculum sp.]